MHYNGANTYLFFNGAETHKFKAKDSKIAAIPSRLENISKDFSVENLKRLDFMDRPLILVLIMMLLQFMVCKRFTGFNEKA